ncbi:MAG: hypothetical protein H0U57_06470 [Tatlockia sp.]|nr:hypothetical protein [Tatlockia sp.]
MYNYLNKSFIAALLVLVSSQYANADSLEGRWQHNGQPTTVRPNYNGMLFCNEQGDCAEGNYRGPGLISVPRWNVTGVINKNKSIIGWSNGTQWTRYNNMPRNEIRVQIGGKGAVAGPWLHEGKPASIQIERDGVHFTIINELGQPTRGYFNANREMVLPTLNIIGRLNKQGRVIQWSNGTTWYRP